MVKSNTIEGLNRTIQNAEKIIEKKELVIQKANDEIDIQRDLIRICRKGLEEQGAGYQSDMEEVMREPSQLDEQYD